MQILTRNVMNALYTSFGMYTIAATQQTAPLIKFHYGHWVRYKLSTHVLRQGVVTLDYWAAVRSLTQYYDASIYLIIATSYV